MCLGLIVWVEFWFVLFVYVAILLCICSLKDQERQETLKSFVKCLCEKKITVRVLVLFLI